MDEEDLRAIDKLLDKKLDPVKENLGEIKEAVNSHTASLMNLEKEIKIYQDSLDVEKKRIDDHEDRLTTIEKS